MPALRTRDNAPGSRSLDATDSSPSPSSSPSSLPSSLPSITSPTKSQPQVHQSATTQTLTAPALQLISPTPRTLIFPTSHNLSLSGLDVGGSPYSSPSHSPFQGGDEYAYGGEGGYGVKFSGDFGGANNNGDFGSDVKFNSNGGEYEAGFEDAHVFTQANFSFVHPNASQQSFVQPNSSFPPSNTFGYAHGNASVQSFHSGSYVLASSPLEGPYSTSADGGPYSSGIVDSKGPYSVDNQGGIDTQKRSGSQLSLTIPELPSFAPYASSPSDTASLRSVSPSGSVGSHRRRKSSSSSIPRDASAERRPKKGDADYVKRPENAFILFRRAQCEERQALETASQNNGAPPAKKQRQADLSKSISERWRNLSAEEKRVWEGRAKEKKEEHAKANPGYVYRPERKNKKGSSSSSTAASSSSTSTARRSSLSRARRASEDSNASLDSPHLSVFVPMRLPSSHSHSHSASISHTNSHSHSNGNSSLQPGAGPHRNTGRSSSAPRPYHRIDFPLVQHGMQGGMSGGRYKREGSEPTSPSLVPLINEHSRMGSAWDYVPPQQGKFGGEGEYPSMSMVSSLFAHQPASAPIRKSSAPSPLSLIAPPSSSASTPSPLSLIVPPTISASQAPTTRSAPTSKAPTADTGSDSSGSSTDSGGNSPFTPSTGAGAGAMFMMPNFETLLEPPPDSSFETSLLDSTNQESGRDGLPSSHMADVAMDMGMGMGLAMDAMDMGFGSSFPGSFDSGFGSSFGGDFGAGMAMEGIDGGAGMGGGGEGAFGSWDWPVGGGLGMDNNWDVGSVPVASLGSSSLSPPSTHSCVSSPPMSPPQSHRGAASNGKYDGSQKHEALVSKFSGLGVGEGGVKYEEGMYGDPTLVGVGGYDDILAGGAFA